MGRDQAFQMLAAVDQALGEQGAVVADQRGMRQAVDMEGAAHDGGIDERQAAHLQPRDHRALFACVVVADKHDVELFGPGEILGDGDQVLAQRAMRRHEQQQLHAARGQRLPMASGAPSMVATSSTGAASPTAGPLPVISAPAGASRICSTPTWRASASSARPRPRMTIQETI